MTMVLEPSGAPAAPSYIVERLKQIHPNLDLKFMRFASTEGNASTYWGLIYKWEENDHRRQMVKMGLIGDGAAYDVLGYLPLDCPIDQAYGYVTRSLKTVPAGQPSSRFIDRVEEFNKNLTKERKEEVHALGEELVKVNAPTLLREEGKSTTKVYQGSK